MTTTTTTKQLGYSYVRFSSEGQSRGDSLRRQTDLAEKYAAEHNIALTEVTYQDLGLSAWHSKNAETGALGAFIEACKSGKIAPGSCLIVESLDRISRDDPRKASRLLNEIVDLGIEVHTIDNGHVYRPGGDFLIDIITSVIEHKRAHEENQHRSDRVRASWLTKKQAAANGKKGLAHTSRLPLWFKSCKLGDRIELDPERAAIIREIFEMTIAGVGSQAVAKYLNDRYEPWTQPHDPNAKPAWQRSYIDKLLNSPAAFGAYQPYHVIDDKSTGVERRLKDGDLIRGYYPAAITEKLYNDARAARAARYRKNRGGGRQSDQIRNYFAGLCYDENAGRSMVYEQRYNRLITDSRGLGQKPHSISYVRFQYCAFAYLDQLDWRSVLGDSDSSELREAEQRVAELTAEATALREREDSIAEAMIASKSEVLARKLDETEQQRKAKETALARAQVTVDDIKARHAALLDNSVVFGKLFNATDLITRAKVREEIRKKIERIRFKFHVPAVTDDDTLALFEFVGGVERALVFPTKNLKVAYGCDLNDPDSLVSIRFTAESPAR